MTARLTPLKFDTACLPGCARFAAWQSALANLDVSRREDAPFAAVARIWLLSPMVIVDAAVDPVRYDRDEQRVRSDSHDHFALVQLISGEFTGDFGRGRVRSTPGSLTVLDMRRACWTDATRLDAFVLSMPRAFLAPSLGEMDPHGMVVSSGMATLLGASLRTICDTLGELEHEQAPIVARLIRDMVAETLLDGRRLNQAPGGQREVALVSRVRAFIDDHLDQTLDVGTIGAAVGVSRSTLYRAFGGSGGVLQQVVRRRLFRLRACLDDPAETRSIADLALTVGFTDKSHAARVFKREYGLTPGEYRRGDGVERARATRMEDVPQLFERVTALLD